MEFATNGVDRRTEKWPRGGFASRAVRSGLPRATVDGKYFARSGERLRLQGVTYGPFRPGPGNEPFPAQARRDFACAVSSFSEKKSRSREVLNVLRVSTALAAPCPLVFLTGGGPAVGRMLPAMTCPFCTKDAIRQGPSGSFTRAAPVCLLVKRDLVHFRGRFRCVPYDEGV
jgi:hypothetical protein